MGQQELAHRQVGEKRRVLRDQGDRVACRVVAELGRGGRIVDQDSPAGRRVAVGEQFDVVDERRLAGAGRPDNAHHLAHRHVDAAEGLRLTVASVPTQDRDLLLTIVISVPRRLFSSVVTEAFYERH